MKHKNLKYITLGAFLLLTINLLLNINLFISKVLAIYVFNNIFMIDYLFGVLVISIFFYEVLFLRKYKRDNKLILKKISISLLILYLLNFTSTYLEGSIITIELAERFEKEELIYYQTTFQYPSLIFTFHNFLLIVFSLFGLWRNKEQNP